MRECGLTGEGTYKVPPALTIKPHIYSFHL